MSLELLMIGLLSQIILIPLLIISIIRTSRYIKGSKIKKIPIPKMDYDDKLLSAVLKVVSTLKVGDYVRIRGKMELCIEGTDFLTEPRYNISMDRILQIIQLGYNKKYAYLQVKVVGRNVTGVIVLSDIEDIMTKIPNSEIILEGLSIEGMTDI